MLPAHRYRHREGPHVARDSTPPSPELLAKVAELSAVAREEGRQITPLARTRRRAASISVRDYIQDPETGLMEGSTGNDDGTAIGGGDSAGGGGGGGDSASILGDTAPSLTTDQQNAVETYQAGGSAYTNDYLRGTENWAPQPDNAQSLTDSLDGAMSAASPTTADATVFRGVDSGTFQGVGVGDTFTDPGFSLTSVSADTAGRFAMGGGTVMQINVPAGSRGLWVGGPEQEYVLSRGSTFQITSISSGTVEATLVH